MLKDLGMVAPKKQDEIRLLVVHSKDFLSKVLRQQKKKWICAETKINT